MTEDEIKEFVESCFPQKALLLVDEVAEGFRKTRRTIYSWYKDDIIHGTNINGTLLIYRVSAIKLMIANHGRKNEDALDDVAEAKPTTKKQTSRRSGRSWVRDY